ncbi:hypothetical protein F5B20DRAFT_121411 [Whalleya microplaca]|nr:hypothetical protein F5B20DRAFT_121411 [Whalleya microplaca]
MDPLSIVAAAFGLMDIMSKTLKEAASFACGIQSARADIHAMKKEFNSIKAAMDILIRNAQKSIPEPLQGKFMVIIDYCVGDVVKIREVLTRFRHLSFAKKVQWAMSGRMEFDTLRSSLKTHNQALDMALTSVNLVIAGDVKGT